MAYILFVNPITLALVSVPDFPDKLRIDQGAVFTATALASAAGCILMGLIARYPIAIAPGMGLNAFFAFSVVLGMGITWEAALSGVFVSGLIFVALSLTGFREKIINAIPAELKLAVGAGIGLFITFVGLQGSGIIANNDNTLVSIGNIHSGPVLLTVFGIVVTVILMVLRVNAGDSYCRNDCWSCPSTDANCGKYSKLVSNLRSSLDSFARHFLNPNACRDFDVLIRWVL